MRMRISFLASALVTLMIISAGVAQAAFYDEQNPNGTPAQAQEIERNKQTIAEAAKSNETNRYLVNSYLDTADDADWYKVFLNPALNDDYITFVHMTTLTNLTSITIHDVNGNQVGNNEFKFNRKRVQDFRVDVPSAGTYYIKVQSLSWKDNVKYRMAIGNPSYSFSSYTHNFPTITLGPSFPKWEGEANLKNIDVPTDAIVHNINLYDETTSAYKEKAYKNDNTYWTAIDGHGINPNVSVYNALKQTWNARYTAQKIVDKKINPSFVFLYIYPDYPENEKYQ